MTWEELHFNSPFVDLHNHAAMKRSMFGRNLGTKKKKFLASLMEHTSWPFSKRTTFPQVEEGGVDVVLSTNYIPEAAWRDDIATVRWVVRLFGSVRKKLFDPTYFDATLGMMDEMELEIEKYNEEKCPEARAMKMVLSSEELQQVINQEDSPTAFIHCVEGAHSLQGEKSGKKIEDCTSDNQAVLNEMLDNLEALYDRGCAYMTLAHFYPNHVAFPIFPYPEWAIPRGKWKEMYGRWDMNLGLSRNGEEIVRKMLDLGMLIDLTHCTPNGRKQVYDIVDEIGASQCVMATHIGAYEINRDPMNLEDWEIKWIADHGGVVGVIFMNYWLSPVDTGMGMKYIEQTLHHITKVSNDTVPAIGTDFDGFTDPPDEMVSIDQVPRLTKYLSSIGHYTDGQISNILGGNALRILKEGWK